MLLNSYTEPTVSPIITPNMKKTSKDTVNVPLVGSVACGTPVLAEENIEGAEIEPVSTIKSGIFIAFNGRLLEGRYVTKTDSEGFDAFTEVNRSSFGEQEASYGYYPHFNRKVRFISIFPGLDADDLRSMVAEDTAAVVLELYGAGGISTGIRNLLPAVQDFVSSGKKVYVVSQCLYGATDLSRYEVGRKLSELGVISMGVSTREYAIVTAMHEA